MTGGRARLQALAGALMAAAALLAGACGGGSDDAEDAPSPAPSPAAERADQSPAEEPQGQAAAGGEEGGSAGVEVYFTSGEQFQKAERELRGPGSKLEQAARALLDGPTNADGTADAEARTQIPGDVALERLSLGDDGTALVELTGSFTRGVPLDPSRRSDAEEQELSARLGQLTYTLTQFEGVRSAKVLDDGVAVEPALARSDYARPSRGPVREVRPRGVQSPDTRKIQQRLAKLRYLPKGAVDGVEGNRTQQAVIAFQSWEGLERDGVVGPATRAALAKAKAPRPQAQGPARRIEVDSARGVALLIDGGITRRAIHVSTGAPGTETPSGSYDVFRKELRSWSEPFSVWLPYASYFNQGIAFHEYPDVPVFPASHGCVRVPAPEAKGLYRFASIGTTVVVL